MGWVKRAVHSLMRSLLRVYRLGMALSSALVHGPRPLPQAGAAPLSLNILNSCIVTSNTLWRGGKVDAQGAQSLVDLGVKTVVNLQFFHDDIDGFQSTQAVLPSQIVYFRIQAWEPFVVIAPRHLDAHIAEFIAITRTQPTPIYVHCRSGQNRTGVMVAAYRVLIEGLPIEAAVAEMALFQGVWFKLYAEYIRSLKGEHRANIECMAQQFESTAKREALLHLSPAGCCVNQ